MSGKIEFGCDFLYLARVLERKADPNLESDPVADAAARLFLVEWGLSVEECDEANDLFLKRWKNGILGDVNLAYRRVVDHVRKDRASQERLIVHLAAVGYMDFRVTADEDAFVNVFMNEFDMRPSEFAALCQHGCDIATVLNFFGKEYLESRTAR